jgi:hypothetical protein
MAFEEEKGDQGLFYVDGSYKKPLINLKVRPKEKESPFW